MKKLFFSLLLLHVLMVVSCSGEKIKSVPPDQPLSEEKSADIRQRLEKHQLPDSVFQDILKAIQGDQAEIVEIDLNKMVGKTIKWPPNVFKEEIQPLQEEILRLDRENTRLLAEIEAETDPKKKAALEEDYWKTFFPKIKAASKALKQKVDEFY